MSIIKITRKHVDYKLPSQLLNAPGVFVVYFRDDGFQRCIDFDPIFEEISRKEKRCQYAIYNNYPWDIAEDGSIICLHGCGTRSIPSLALFLDGMMINSRTDDLNREDTKPELLMNYIKDAINILDCYRMTKKYNIPKCDIESYKLFRYALEKYEENIKKLFFENSEINILPNCFNMFHNPDIISRFGTPMFDQDSYRLFDIIFTERAELIINIFILLCCLIRQDIPTEIICGIFYFV